ncbi:hypothetical protein O6H91_21G050900 [Diphasiastrum complanatum]|uniref:Uncharacterized protein n=1 Tax=Diphasiastrum complanatum TaxID=34168 RepID=A0ACC2AKC5_DIPCM|nr:hypothetical protein O6H91_21G050900 [Diphasiastrum complanatum]
MAPALVDGGSTDDEEDRLPATAGFPVVGVQEFADSESLSASQMKLRKMLKKKAKSGGFESMGLSPSVFRGVKRKGYRVPTPIQRKTLPRILAGYDVVAMARTGSGKTAAFLIPILEKLKMHTAKAGARALILSPTRELAFQTQKFFKELGRYTDLKSVALVGGDSMEAQFEELANNPDVIIATPGRLMHHLSEVEGMSLTSVEYVVFDEADRLFEMGFAEQLRQILRHLNDSRQTLLFSATLPKLLADFAKAGLRDPHLIRLDIETKISPDLKLQFFTFRQEEKPAALVHLIGELIPSDQQTIIFVSTKHHVEFLYEVLKSRGIDISVVYGAMDQAARKIHIAKFRARKTTVLLVTDVAARGIDIPLLDNVVNFDFPPTPKLFVHRVGRAARAGRSGTAYSFVTAEEVPYMLDLHLFLSKPVFPAPTEDEVAENGERILETLENAISRGETVYGRFPQSIIDIVMDRLRESVHASTELMALEKSCSNAFRLYAKTRPSASLESCKRARSLAREGLHFLFRQEIGDQETAAAALAERLKMFRPKQTVLEAEGEASKIKNKQVASVQIGDIMKRKRAVHEHVINAHHSQKFWQQVTSEKIIKEESIEGIDSPTKRRKDNSGRKKLPESYKDKEFYINSTPSNQYAEGCLSVRGGDNFGHNRLDTEIMDLAPDEESGALKQRARYHWDKRSKKFIKLHQGEKITSSGKIKTEAGVKVNAGNRGIYKKWKERTHMEVPTMNEERETGHFHTAEGRQHGSVNSGGHSKPFVSRNQKRHKVPNAHVRSELRGVEEVRKHRQKEMIKKYASKGGKGTHAGKGKGKSRVTHGGKSKGKFKGKSKKG